MKALTVLLVLSAVGAAAQPLLTVDEAVRQALADNRGVRIARRSADIDRVNSTAGNAGMLPSLSLTGSGSQSRSWVSEHLASGAHQSAGGGQSSAVGGGVSLGWTLYDGGRMFATRDRLAEAEAQGAAAVRERVQQTVYDVVAAYYDIVRARQDLASVREAADLNRERVHILETGVAAGQTQRANLLQARIDLNTYLGRVLAQEVEVTARRRALDLLMGRDPGFRFSVADSIPVPSAMPDTARLAERSPGLEPLRRQVAVAQAAAREAQGLRRPNLSLSAAYAYQRTGSGSGSVREASTSGPQAGLSLALPLYQGGNLVRQVRVASLELESAQLALENGVWLVRAQAEEAADRFAAQQQVLALERASLELGRENLDIARQRLRAGQGTSLEFREAQDAYVSAATRLSSVRYDLLLAATRLRQLTGDLQAPE